MIYKVDSNILNIILDKLPFLRYNDTEFLYKEERLYGNIILRRIEGKLDINADFEKDKNSFIEISRAFLDENITKTFNDTKNYLFVGSVIDDLQVTQIPNWRAIENLFIKLNLQCKLCFSRYIISIPCGTLNLNITRLDKSKETYLEIIELCKDNEQKKLVDLLNLKEPFNKEWLDLVKDL